jgi:hypothetical protein
MADNQIRIRYLGTNVGKVYLSDVGKRLGLGGGQEGGYGYGQDQYIVWGETLILQATGEVLMSAANGVLKYFSSAPTSGAWLNGAPLVIDFNDYTSASDSPLRAVSGATGRYTDTVLSALAGNKNGITGGMSYSPSAGATGYYYGNSDLPGITGASA